MIKHIGAEIGDIHAPRDIIIYLAFYSHLGVPFFTAMEHPIPALTISFGRSLVLITGCLVVLSTLFQDRGIWLSPLVSEGLCLIITLCFLLYYFRKLKRTEASG